MGDEITAWRWRQLRQRAALITALAATMAMGAWAWRWIPTSEPTRRLIRAPRDGGAVRAPPRLEHREGSPPRPEDTGEAPRLDLDIDALLDDLAVEIDRARARGARCGRVDRPPSGPVGWSVPLEEAASRHLDHMADHDDWAHSTPGNPWGTDPTDRAAASGYRGHVAGEVIAWGQRTPREAVEWWLSSPPHCAALLDPTATEAGGAVTHDPHTPGLAWVVVLGSG